MALFQSTQIALTRLVHHITVGELAAFNREVAYKQLQLKFDDATRAAMARQFGLDANALVVGMLADLIGSHVAMTDEEMMHRERLTLMNVIDLDGLQEFFGLRLRALRDLKALDPEYKRTWDDIKRRVDRAVIIQGIKSTMNIQHAYAVMKEHKRGRKYALVSFEMPLPKPDPVAVAELAQILVNDKLTDLHYDVQDALFAAGPTVDPAIRAD